MARVLRVALEHVRLVSLLGLVGAAGWAFVGWMTLDMGHPWVVLMMPTSSYWRAETVVAVAMMWAMMMVAMMLPSAALMIATFDGLERCKAGPAAEPWRTTVFVAGYLVIWLGFSQLHMKEIGAEVHVDKKFLAFARDSKSSLGWDRKEVEANRFASELLVPNRMLIHELSGRLVDVENEDLIANLAERFQVSRQMMTFRIGDLVESRFKA